MQVHEFTVQRKRRKRVGRGIGSRRGTYSGRGIKGQKARAGARVRPGFEGGRTPLVQRLPKRRGFRSPHPKAAIVNLGMLALRFPSGTTITRAALVRAGLAPAGRQPIKILSNGDIHQPLTIQGLAVSASAKAKIEAAGGAVVALPAHPTSPRGALRSMGLRGAGPTPLSP